MFSCPPSLVAYSVTHQCQAAQNNSNNNAETTCGYFICLAEPPRRPTKVAMSLASGSGISCPNGGSFYVCQGNSTQFLGCCTEDPCADGAGSCPDSALRNTSYSSSLYDSIPPQTCVDTGLWYTCAETNPPFMGCCLTNPCLLGSCSGGNLTAARLSDNTTDASPFETAATTTTASASPSSSADSQMHMSSLSTGAIVGIAIGSAVVALVVGIVLFCCYKRFERRKNQQQLAGQGQLGPNGTPGIYVPSPYQGKHSLFSSFPSSQFRNRATDRCDRLQWLPKSALST